MVVLFAFVAVGRYSDIPWQWRWHKWGPYIGTKEPKCEYLYDEPEIDKVVIFELYEIS